MRRGRSWIVAVAVTAALAAACSSSSAAPKQVDCESAGLVATANRTLAAIVQTGLQPIAGATDPEQTQELIDQYVPKMNHDLTQLVPAYAAALHNLGLTLPSDLREDTTIVSSFVRQYAAAAAGITDIDGVNAVLALETSTSEKAFEASIRRLSTALDTSCGISLDLTFSD